MACGCPVAASRAGSLPEVVGDAALSFDHRRGRSPRLAGGARPCGRAERAWARPRRGVHVGHDRPRPRRGLRAGDVLQAAASRVARPSSATSSSKLTSGSRARGAPSTSPTRSWAPPCPGRTTGRCGRARARRARRRRRRRRRALDRARDTRRHDVVPGLVVLHHQPHRADVVAGVAPVAAGREGRRARARPRGRARSPRRHARPSGQEVHGPERRLVDFVEDPAAREHPVPLAVAPRDEVRVGLRDAVRRQRARGHLLVCGDIAAGSPRNLVGSAW